MKRLLLLLPIPAILLFAAACSSSTGTTGQTDPAVRTQATTLAATSAVSESGLIAATSAISESATSATTAAPTAASTETAASSARETNPVTTAVETTAETTVGQIQTEPDTSPIPAAPAGIGDSLAIFLADPANGQAAGQRAVALNGGEWHNACVYTVSEVLRRVGCDIPDATNYTATLIGLLRDRGFQVNRDLTALQPGDICFTTNEAGQANGIPTHTYVFLGWIEPGLASIYDNQIYDYGSLYHARPIGLTYFNEEPDRPKEATAFFMHR